MVRSWPNFALAVGHLPTQAPHHSIFTWVAVSSATALKPSRA